MAILRDPPEENWPSMDLVSEMLVAEWCVDPEVDVTALAVPIPKILRRVRTLSPRTALNADRLLARFVRYPARVVRVRRDYDMFHVADHTYAQLVHALPGSRCGVYCHDLDAFRALLPGSKRPAWFRMLSRILLEGMRSAAVIFHSTRAVGDELVRHGLVPRERLVHAPYGVSADFDARAREGDECLPALAPLAGHRFLLHVGSAIPRKRIDVLFEVFARVRRTIPDLFLVQQGGDLTGQQKDLARRLGIDGALVQPSKLSRAELAVLYRRAALVLVPSDYEGFGLPVIEALACGAPVLASDIGVLREVGGDAAMYRPVADIASWSDAIERVVAGTFVPPSHEERLDQASKYTWKRHATILLDAYRDVFSRSARPRAFP